MLSPVFVVPTFAVFSIVKLPPRSLVANDELKFADLLEVNQATVPVTLAPTDKAKTAKAGINIFDFSYV